MADVTQRFSRVVGHYTRYRPDYPQALIDTLITRCSPGKGFTVADIGAGTGILTRQLLERGLDVIAVEPNGPMRQAADAELSHFPGYRSVEGRAEQTTLAEASVDLVTAAQAFHWFEVTASRLETQRIGKPGAQVALIWNQRDQTCPFQQAYHALLSEHLPDYRQNNQTRIDDNKLREFYAPAGFELFEFAHQQSLTSDALTGRLHSASYMPDARTPQARTLTKTLQQLFEQHQQDGELIFRYRSRLYLGSP